MILLISSSVTIWMGRVNPMNSGRGNSRSFYSRAQLGIYEQNLPTRRKNYTRDLVSVWHHAVYLPGWGEDRSFHRLEIRDADRKLVEKGRGTVRIQPVWSSELYGRFGQKLCLIAIKGFYNFCTKENHQIFSRNFVDDRRYERSKVFMISDQTPSQPSISRSCQMGSQSSHALHSFCFLFTFPLPNSLLGIFSVH
ncbi:hypothetical protein NC651_040535 [Populus alba x Populus x berolinensis]|nr:hypothetical protein NC651_040535 [Populus alba x Populus x berolinensis]